MAVYCELWLTCVGILVATLFTQFVVGYWVHTRRDSQSGATWFLVMDVTGVVFVGGALLFLLFQDPGAQQAAYIAAGVGSMTTISAFVVFASKYTGTGLHQNRVVQATLAAIVGGYIILAPTNASHGLLYASFTPVAEPFPHLVVERGIVLHTMVTAIQIPAFYSTYLMGKHLLATRQQAGQQLIFLILGAFSIGLLDLLSVWTNLFPVNGFTYAPFGMFVFYVFTAFALFRFSLLDIQPIARNTVTENLRDPVLVLDEEGCIVDHNEAATAVWPAIAESLQEEFTEACPALADTVSIPPTAGTATERLSLSLGGQERHYSVTVSEVSRRGESASWYSMLLRDVTELERSRWQLEKKNDRLDQVASTISHDLRNPISVADGYARSLELQINDWDIEAAERERATDELTRVQESLGRMEAIIDDVLTVAREGKTVEDTDSIPLSVVAREAWNNVDTAEASLTLEADSILDANRNRTLSILENLFRNTLDHCESTVTVTVGATPDGFFVADDGPGVPVSHRNEIFEYGYTTTDEGTGLGLSIVRTMAESHGWTVELDTGYHDGTRFVFGGVRSFPTATA